ncbi:MAG: hypothetical protein ACKPKO_33190, partial [Candidatus Fonsibacter sp.]
MAWRATPEQTQKLEYALKLVYPRPCHDNELMLAVFEDSTTVAINAITVVEYKSMTQEKDSAASGALWHADGQDREAITITMKNDKKQLVLINVTGKQCLQIAIEKLHNKDGDNKLDDMELKTTVVGFMQYMAEQYTHGN